MAKILEYGTVRIRLTDPDTNIEHLANILAIMMFEAGFTETESKEALNEVIEDQFFQAIMGADQSKQSP